MTLHKAESSLDPRLLQILSSDANCIAFAKKGFADIKFAELNGELWTTAHFFKQATGLQSTSNLFFEDYETKEFIEGAEPHLYALSDRGAAADFAKALGLSERSFNGPMKAHGHIYLYSPQSVVVAMLTSKHSGEYPDFGLPSTGTKARRLLYAAMMQEFSKPVEQTADTTGPADKPKWEPPADMAFVDASLWMRGSACAIAAFHPASMTAEVVYSPMSANIDTLEMQAAALAHHAYKATYIISDSKNSATRFGKYKEFLSNRGKDEVRSKVDHVAYALRDLLLAGGSLQWVAREKNIVADAIAVWASKNHYSGGVSVEFLTHVNLANPVDVDTESEWIRITPNAIEEPSTKRVSVDELIMRLQAKCDDLRIQHKKIETEMIAAREELIAVEQHREILERYTGLVKSVAA